MANTSRIRGFTPVKHTSGAPYNSQGNIYAVAATDGVALFVGDPVTLDGSANAAGVATVTKASASGTVLGVITGFVPVNVDPVTGSMTAGSVTLDTPQYRLASTARYVYVEDSDDVLYEVEQATGANASYTYLAADIGLNAGHTTVAGSTSTGQSSCAIDMSTKATTASLPWKLVGAIQRVDNETISGTSTAVKLLVKLNNATIGNGNGATGV